MLLLIIPIFVLPIFVLSQDSIARVYPTVSDEEPVFIIFLLEHTDSFVKYNKDKLSPKVIFFKSPKANINFVFVFCFQLPVLKALLAPPFGTTPNFPIGCLGDIQYCGSNIGPFALYFGPNLNVKI